MQKLENKIILQKGEVLLREGAPAPKELYIISGGKVAVFKQFNGKQEKISELGESELIGEISFFSDTNITATVIAMEETVLFYYDEKHIWRLIRNNPKIAEKIIRTLAERLKNLENRINDSNRKK